MAIVKKKMDGMFHKIDSYQIILAIRGIEETVKDIHNGLSEKHEPWSDGEMNCARIILDDVLKDIRKIGREYAYVLTGIRWDW